MSMQLISTVTVGSGGASSIIFSSIPQNYTDLFLVTSVRSNLSGSTTYQNITLSVNGATSNFSNRLLFGFSGSVASASASGSGLAFLLYATTAATTANTFASGQVYFPNYSGNTFKSISSDSVNENNATDGGFNNISAGLWSDTAAITSISFVCGASTIVQGSTASLYGILKGSGGATVS